jgi:hypothetical protein
MAQLTFPIVSRELKLRVLIGHNRPALARLIAAGQLPAPVWTKGVLDTGTNITCVTPAVLQSLGLRSTTRTRTHTVGGRAGVRLFRVSVSIPPRGNVAGPMLNEPNLKVMEMPAPIPGVEVLIGMDLLLNCRLIVDGPARQFSLEF